MTLNKYTISELETMLQNKEISATEVAELSLQAIKETDKDVKAFLTLNEENVKAQAKALDEAGTFDKKLAAIPGSMKDNIVTKGIRTTAASAILENLHDPLYDATVVEKLAAEDAFMMGKVNLDEFAMGGTTETSAFQKTANPWNLDHVPGGSSGGSGASVAAGQVLFSIGTDTGGSIRKPASYCGIVGMKPTYGLVSRYGVTAFAPSLDHVGPLTRTVADNAAVLEVIAGHDRLDGTSANKAGATYSDALIEDVKGLKIAVPKQFLAEGVDEEVKEATKKALQMYEQLGAIVEEVDVPELAYAGATYFSIAYAEGASSLARYDGIRFGKRSENAKDMIDVFTKSRTEGFGKEAKRRILIGSTLLSGQYNEAYFRKAQKVRTVIKNAFVALFDQYDVVVGPSTATPAQKFDETLQVGEANEILSTPANLAGLPSISVPAGFTKAGLPVGLQIVGKHFAEATIYRAAYTFEQATKYYEKHPIIGGAN